MGVVVVLPKLSKCSTPTKTSKKDFNCTSHITQKRHWILEYLLRS